MKALTVYQTFARMTGALFVVAFAFSASACLGAPTAGPGRSATRATDGGVVLHNKAAAVSTASEVPKNWPWKGVTLADFGLPGAPSGSKLGPPGSGPQDIDDAARAGANSVHLYLGIKKLAQYRHLSNAQAWQEAMQWLDVMLAECRKDNLVAIVGFQSFPLVRGGYYSNLSTDLWQNSAAVDEIYSEVAKLADHLRHYGSEFAAYDIISEPTMRTGHGAVQPPGWIAIQDRIVRTIRAEDPDRWIVVKPGPWGGTGGYRNFAALPYPRLIYSVHIYAPHQYTYQGINGHWKTMNYPGKVGRRTFDKQTLETYLTPLFRFQKRNNALIWVGEFSAVTWAPDSSQYLTDLASIFDDHGWGWSYFAIGGWFGWDPNYSSQYSTNWTQAQAHRVGMASERWQTLKKLFKGGSN